jgi:ribosomal protein S27AE
MFFCFVCDEQRDVVGSRPINGVCGNCGGLLSEVQVRDMFRFCFVPLFWTHKNRILCSRCGAQYQSHYY